jgi:hypothetical protein
LNYPSTPPLLFHQQTEVQGMPRFFFHYRDRDGLAPDLEGEEFPDHAAANQEARLAAREIVGEALLAGRELYEEAHLEVMDEGDQVIGRVMLADTVA